MSERVPLSKILSAGSITVDANLATRFTSLPKVPEASFDDLRAQFYFSFLDALGTNQLVEFLTAVTPAFANLSDDLREEPLQHPTIGRDPHIQPEPNDPWFIPFFLTRQWLLLVLAGEWEYDRAAQAHKRSDARVPHWLTYSFAEIARLFLAAEPEDYTSSIRTKAFLRYEAHDTSTTFRQSEMPSWRIRSLLAGMPRTAAPIIFLSARATLQMSDESRESVLARIVAEVADEVLAQLVPSAETIEELGEMVGSFAPRKHSTRLDIAQRAEECARRVLGQAPSDGSSRTVQDGVLVTLGFLESRRA